MKYIALIVLICFGSFLEAQNDDLLFPLDFFGVYKGTLVIQNTNGMQEIDMEFHFKETNTIGEYQYTLVYIMNGNRQERLYKLIEKDANKGEYIVDENNGILLDAKLVNNTLYSMYEVQGNILTTTERFYKDGMDFEVTFSSKKAQNKSGTEGNSATEVVSYPITVVQKAILIRQPD